MHIKQVELHTGLDTLVFEDETRMKSEKVNAYGEKLAIILSILRAVARFFTCGQTCKENLIAVVFDNKKYYIFPTTVASICQKLGEVPPKTIDQAAVDTLLKQVSKSASAKGKKPKVKKHPDDALLDRAFKAGRFGKPNAAVFEKAKNLFLNRQTTYDDKHQYALTANKDKNDYLVGYFESEDETVSVQHFLLAICEFNIIRYDCSDKGLGFPIYPGDLLEKIRDC